MNATGAVLAARRTAQEARHYNGDHHGVPVFVLSRLLLPPEVADYPRVTYATDGIASATARAKAAAGAGAAGPRRERAPQALEARALDESRRSTRSRRCSGSAVDCSRSDRRASSWRSSR